MADKQRKMTDKEIDAYMVQMRKGIESHLNGIAALLPPGYVMTLVARDPNADDASMVLTKDTDLEAVANILLANKVK